MKYIEEFSHLIEEAKQSLEGSLKENFEGSMYESNMKELSLLSEEENLKSINVENGKNDPLPSNDVCKLPMNHSESDKNNGLSDISDDELEFNISDESFIHEFINDTNDSSDNEIKLPNDDSDNANSSSDKNKSKGNEVNQLKDGVCTDPVDKETQETVNLNVATANNDDVASSNEPKMDETIDSSKTTINIKETNNDEENLKSTNIADLEKTNLFSTKDKSKIADEDYSDFENDREAEEKLLTLLKETPPELVIMNEETVDFEKKSECDTEEEKVMNEETIDFEKSSECDTEEENKLLSFLDDSLSNSYPINDVNADIYKINEKINEKETETLSGLNCDDAIGKELSNGTSNYCEERMEVEEQDLMNKDSTNIDNCISKSDEIRPSSPTNKNISNNKKDDCIKSVEDTNSVEEMDVEEENFTNKETSIDSCVGTNEEMKTKLLTEQEYSEKKNSSNSVDFTSNKIDDTETCPKPFDSSKRSKSFGNNEIKKPLRKRSYSEDATVDSHSINKRLCVDKLSDLIEKKRNYKSDLVTKSDENDNKKDVNDGDNKPKINESINGLGKLINKAKQNDKSESNNVDKSESEGDNEKPFVKYESKETQFERETITKDLSFLKRINKDKFKSLTRTDLEELLFLKITEAFVDKSEISESRNTIQKLEENQEKWKKRCSFLEKTNKEIKSILTKYLRQVEEQESNIHKVVPMRVTRSVGLQVALPGLNRNRKINRELQASSHHNQNTSTAIPSRSPMKVTTNPHVSSSSKTTLSTSPQKTNSPSVQTGSPRQVTKVQPTAQNTTSTSNNIAKKPLAPLSQTSVIKRVPPILPSPQNSTSSNLEVIDLTDKEEQNILRLKSSSNLTIVSHSNNSSTTTTVNTVRPVSASNFINKSNNTNQLVTIPGTMMVKNGTIVHTSPTPTPTNFVVRSSANTIQRNLPTIRYSSANLVHQLTHPAPLPPSLSIPSQPGWLNSPPRPILKVSKTQSEGTVGIMLSWSMTLTKFHEKIASYQLYAYQESNIPPNTNLWKKVGDVKALELPMACTLTQFVEGHKYHFAVRAVDVHSRVGLFSAANSILLNK